MTLTGTSRESAAPQPALKKFFAPSSAAIVGASEDVSKYGGLTLQCMIRFGYRGKIYPINPRYTEVQGLPCYPSLLEVPGPIDHAGIVVPARMVMDTLKQCEAKGIPFVTVFTSGFAETGTPEGIELQRQITEFAHRTGIRIMGPNCNGVINFVDGFTLAYTSSLLIGERQPAGRVGIVSQSGGVGQVNVMWRAQELGLNISYEVSCGNNADLDVLDYVQFMVEDDATDVILVVAEGFKSGDRLAEVARLAREREKPIVVLKLGRTEAGSRAAASHTGAMTGADDVYDAAFRQFGLIRVDDFNDLYEYALLLARKRWPRGDGVAAMSISGGNVVLLTDMGARLGIKYPELTPSTQARLAELMPDFGGVRNPMDMTTAAVANRNLFREVLAILAEDDNVSVLVPIIPFLRKRYVEEVKAVAARTDKPLALLWTGGCFDDPSVTVATFTKGGVPTYRNTASCLKAVSATIEYGKFLRRTEGAAGSQTGPTSPTRPAGPSHLEELRAKLRAATGPLTERASKEILAAYGFPVTREALAKTAEEAVRLAREIGYPVAMKIESADIPHKTESGALRLGLTSEEAVRIAFEEVHEAARRYRPEARVEGALVQEMVSGGRETLLGITTDATFGPVVVAGLGGIHVELERDVTYRIPPVDLAEAHRMLRELRGYRLLEGVRGAAPRDVDALAELIVRTSRLALDLAGALAEMDINPLMLLPKGSGARVVDALLVPRSR